MMSDTQDLGNFGLLKLGISPEKSTLADWQAAGKALTQQRDAGLVRGYYGQSYIDELTSGNTWISMAWSGDIFQQNLSSGSALEFVIPDEGGTLWTDNMMIPRYAQNPVDAMMLMDWYYRPPIAAQLTESINYISAVPAAQPIIARHAAKASGSSHPPPGGLRRAGLLPRRTTGGCTATRTSAEPGPGRGDLHPIRA
jgi:spermidine/putrescine transport system substrate-binding protein